MLFRLVLTALYLFCFILQAFIFIRVIVSWININKDNKFIEFIINITEPILSPVRKLIDKSIFGGKGRIFDFSPFIALVILQFMANFLSRYINWKLF